MAPEIAIALFRRIQEALSNGLRHAEACKTSIRARATAQELGIRIQDNGIGFSLE